MSDQGCKNTDREIYREREGDYYADSVHVTENGSLGMNVGGLVIVKPIKDWHKLVADTMKIKRLPKDTPND